MSLVHQRAEYFERLLCKNESSNDPPNNSIPRSRSAGFQSTGLRIHEIEQVSKARRVVSAKEQFSIHPFDSHSNNSDDVVEIDKDEYFKSSFKKAIELKESLTNSPPCSKSIHSKNTVFQKSCDADDNVIFGSSPRSRQSSETCSIETVRPTTSQHNIPLDLYENESEVESLETVKLLPNYIPLRPHPPSSNTSRDFSSSNCSSIESIFDSSSSNSSDSSIHDHSFHFDKIAYYRSLLDTDPELQSIKLQIQENQRLENLISLDIKNHVNYSALAFGSEALIDTQEFETIVGDICFLDCLEFLSKYLNPLGFTNVGSLFPFLPAPQAKAFVLVVPFEESLQSCTFLVVANCSEWALKSIFPESETVYLLDPVVPYSCVIEKGNVTWNQTQYSSCVDVLTGK